MKTELFEKLMRKIIREEIEFYMSKIIKEISEVKKKSLVNENNESHPKVKDIQNEKTVKFTSENINLKESLMSFKNELDKEYGFNDTSMKFDGMEVPPELESVFNKDYRDFMKKVK